MAGDILLKQFMVRKRHLAVVLDEFGGTAGILTMEDLAEQSIDELMDIENMEEERAGSLIMEARAPWFEE